MNPITAKDRTKNSKEKPTALGAIKNPELAQQFDGPRGRPNPGTAKDYLRPPAEGGRH